VGRSAVEHRPKEVWHPAFSLRKSSTKADCYDRYGYADTLFAAILNEISKQESQSNNSESTPKGSISIDLADTDITETIPTFLE
jgi:hypothetical protein